MKFVKTKALLFAVFLLFLLFFSNNFGEIDIEKTAIITAIAIDYAEEEYEVTAEIAVPEANSTSSENLKAEISTKGKTVGEALKNIGSETGWYPQLYFCNLIILGKELARDNTLKILDYLARTLRVQDSAEIVICEGKAKELLEKTTPLDNISSFAMQKILLKSKGFDCDVVNMSIRTFNIDYYNRNSSSYMPIVSIKNTTESKNPYQADGSNTDISSTIGNSGEKGADKNNHYLYNALHTALFLKGKMVGELTPLQSLAFNLIRIDCSGTGLNVTVDDGVGEPKDYLVMIMKNKYKTNVKATKDSLDVIINLKVTCDVADQSTAGSDSTLAKNLPIPTKVKEEIEKKLTTLLTELVETERQTGCDFLKIEEKIYRYNHKYFSQYKDDYIQKMNVKVNVEATGQK